MGGHIASWHRVCGLLGSSLRCFPGILLGLPKYKTSGLAKCQLPETRFACPLPDILICELDDCQRVTDMDQVVLVTTSILICTV